MSHATSYQPPVGGSMLEAFKEWFKVMSPLEKALLVDWVKAELEAERWRPIERGGPGDL